jgi:hypothetical protein
MPAVSYEGFTGKRKDYTGQKFGRLTAISMRIGTGRRSIWTFACDCGGTTETQMAHVKSGATRSCGCLRSEVVRNMFRMPDGLAIKKSAYASHLRGAADRNLYSNLSFSEYVGICSKPCHYCGAMSQRHSRRHTSRKTYDTIPFNSADRLNNEPYYDLDNTVSSCFNCQRFKWGLRADDYISLCKRVAAHQSKGQQ